MDELRWIKLFLYLKIYWNVDIDESMIKIFCGSNENFNWVRIYMYNLSIYYNGLCVTIYTYLLINDSSLNLKLNSLYISQTSVVL